MQLALEFSGVETCEIRGNVPTRLRKLREEESLDGLVLALAGLKRLGFCNALGEWVMDDFRDFELKLLDSMLPAPGQGAVAIQTRADDTELLERLQSVHCKETALCVTAERALLSELGGGCHLALGARAKIFQKKKKTQMDLRAVYFPEEDCTNPLSGSVQGSPERPHELAAKLKNQWNKK
jgi:hydroxymethylbilane synthase